MKMTSFLRCHLFDPRKSLPAGRQAPDPFNPRSIGFIICSSSVFICVLLGFFIYFSEMKILTLIIIIMSLSGIAIGRYPGLRMNRATISLVGATLLVVIGSITLQQAYASIDFDTITLLLAMMIINVNLQISGFFQLVMVKVITIARSPVQLLVMIIIVSGSLSALFLNDTICIMLTPLVAEIILTLKRNPIPYLIALAASANIGSTATIVGNPQNMLIGISSKIGFSDFFFAQFPVALSGMLIAFVVIYIIYRKEFSSSWNSDLHSVSGANVRLYKPLLRKSIFASVVMLVLFFSGVSIPLAALTGASILLITRRLKPQRVFTEIDWALLVFFSGLFIITGALEASGLSKKLFTSIQPYVDQGMPALAFTSSLLSNLISNVPAVMLYRPIIPAYSDPHQAWLVLAMATTLAGNLTLLGSVANLIVAESARRKGIELSFTEYLKAGFPIAVITICFGLLLLL